MEQNIKQQNAQQDWWSARRPAAHPLIFLGSIITLFGILVFIGVSYMVFNSKEASQDMWYYLWVAPFLIIGIPFLFLGIFLLKTRKIIVAFFYTIICSLFLLLFLFFILPQAVFL